ncbi:hypothetical protein CDL38_14655 [Escherichia coli]|nr:hypothetical protein CDL38_14655 [Escherichia coli]
MSISPLFRWPNSVNHFRKACDGVMAEFAWKVVRIANELPMIEQEAKSYATNHVTELLVPYRLESNQRKMVSWGSW